MLADSLPIARQIADAIEAAHAQGVVHRDLKPANVKVRADGTVKVLDFGLAKAMDPAGTSAATDVANSPTLTAPATAMGVIMGTAAYMSPEQAAGKSVDRRSDLWSFGVVLLEMLTGRRTFDGETVSHVLASVLKDAPDFSALPADTPASIRKLLRRCLEKDRKKRLDSAAAARLEIDDAMPGASDVAAVLPAAPVVASAPSGVLPWAVAGVLAAALGVVLWLWAPWITWRGTSSATAAALSLTPLSFEQGGQTAAVWSPDGKAVAFAARQRDTEPYQVFVRYLALPAPTQITKLPGGVTGIIEWTASGKIVFYGGGLWSVSPVGGEPEPFGRGVGSAAKLVVVAVPSITRDGSTLAGVFRGEDGMVSIWTRAVEGTELKRYEPAPFATRTVFSGVQLRFSPDGRQLLLWRDVGSDGQEAWLMPYPATANQPPRQILQGLKTSVHTPTFSWLPDNRHIVVSAEPAGKPTQLYLADTVSSEFSVLSTGTRAQTAPAVSPDGSRLVFLEANTDYDIVSTDLTTAALTPVIASERSEGDPAWAARAASMVYVTDRNGPEEIWLHIPGQTDRPLVTPGDFPLGTTAGFGSPTLSPDGARVIYRWITTGRPGGLWISAVAGGPPVRLVKGSQAREAMGSWSPDGNWYVYFSTESGRNSLNKVKTTGEGVPVVLKSDIRSTAWAVWSPANDWIAYSDAGVKFIAPDGASTRDLTSALALVYAFSADGRTLYGVRQPNPSGAPELFSMNVASGSEKTIGLLPRDAAPAAQHGSLRLSLTPDGKSLAYSIARTSANLWLMDGLQLHVR